MEKKFLVTLSNDADHLFGVQFLCSFYGCDAGHHLTLLHIYRTDSNDMAKAVSSMWEDSSDNVAARVSVGAKRSINKAEKILSGCSFSLDRIMTKTVSERYGKVKDILMEGSRGLYDAVVLGRRASYTLQWVFERPADETGKAMISDRDCVTPLWICPSPEPDRKNVLVCVDGSENGYRAVDHVGYILSDNQQHSVTLFNVKNSGSIDSEQIFQRAQAILQEHKISRERIRQHSTWGLSVSGAILAEVDSGGYAAVAMGMRGLEQGIMKKISLAGGTTTNILNRIEKTSLWCCP